MLADLRGAWLLVLLPAHLAAQSPREESPTALVALWRTSTDAIVKARAFTALQETLQQKHRDVPRVVLDSIGDGLTEIALEPIRGDRVPAASALALLQLGGSSGRKPYAGAFERVQKVYEKADEIGVRGSALQILTELPDNRRALPIVEKLAVSRESETMVDLALGLLASKFGDEGRRTLARIDDQGLIQVPFLKQQLHASKAKGYRYRGGVIH